MQSIPSSVHMQVITAVSVWLSLVEMLYKYHTKLHNSFNLHMVPLNYETSLFNGAHFKNADFGNDYTFNIVVNVVCHCQ